MSAALKNAAARSAAIEKLRARIARLEPARRAGLAAIEAEPWRAAAPGALYEIAGKDWRDSAAASGYALALAGAIAKKRAGAVLFLALRHEERDAGRLYAPEKSLYGIDGGRFVFCLAGDVKALLWAAEEAARSPSTAALIIDIGKPHRLLTLSATRRLQLAAESSGATPLLLRNAEDREPSAALRRFRLSPAPSAPFPYDARAPGAPRWRVEIDRCRLGMRGDFVVEWDEERGELATPPAVHVPSPAALADGPARRSRAVA
ncbi:MAG: hypothetical protein R3C60_14245 [Parvularculaceae bacterium]